MSDVDSKTIEQAGEKLFDEVYVPAFLKQCAARGLSISTQEDLELALQNALMLKSAEASESQPENGSVHKAANLTLRRYFGEDVDETEKRASVETQVAEVTDGLENNEGVAKAAALLASLGQEATAA